MVAYKMWILPVRCEECGATFDLWYDLNEQEDARRTMLEERILDSTINQNLCWNCRKNKTKNIKKERTTTFEMELEL